MSCECFKLRGHVCELSAYSLKVVYNRAGNVLNERSPGHESQLPRVRSTSNRISPSADLLHRLSF